MFFVVLMSLLTITTAFSPSPSSPRSLRLPLASDVRSFGTAVKAIQLEPDVETILFDYEVPSDWHKRGTAERIEADSSPIALVTQMWFTGDLLWLDFQESYVRVYVDNEKSPSIEGPIGLLHGIGFDDLSAPWGTASMGKLAGLGGGIYNSHRIPFDSHLRVTIETMNQKETRGFYFMIRGLLGSGPVVLPQSMLQLPSNARLRVFTTESDLKPTEWTTLVNVSGGVGGLVYLTVQELDSENAHCLEGIHTAEIDSNTTIATTMRHSDGQERRGNDTNGTESEKKKKDAKSKKEKEKTEGRKRSKTKEESTMLLSSGFEDYYLSAQYFDKGTFHTPLSGYTHHSGTRIEPKKVSAYRFHTADPIVWQQSFVFQWRNGMHVNGTLGAGNTHHRSVVWVYLW